MINDILYRAMAYNKKELRNYQTSNNFIIEIFLTDTFIIEIYFSVVNSINRQNRYQFKIKLANN